MFFKKFIYNQNDYFYPINIMLNITDDCNLACKYCFVEQHPHYMSLDIAIQAVDWCYKNYLFKKENNLLDYKDQKPFLNFFGGEPMLMFEKIIKPLVFYIKDTYQNLFELGITTNCTLLSKEKIDFLAINNIHVLCSIDGDEETQCYNRPCRNNQNSHQLINNNIQYLLEKIPNAMFRMTGYAPTIKYLFQNYKYAESLGFHNFAMCLDERHPWSKQNIKELEQGLSAIFYYQLMQQLKGQPYMYYNAYDNFANIFHYFGVGKINNNTCLRCGLGTTSCSIGWDGKIYGCQQDTSLDNKNIFLIGNLDNGINIKQHIKLLKKYYYSYYNIKQLKCYNCKLKEYCYSFQATCPSTNYALFKNMNKKTKIHCLYYKMIYKLSILNTVVLLSLGDIKEERSN